MMDISKNFPITETQPWRIFELDEIPDSPPFYSQSPFGYLALRLAKELKIELPGGVSARLGLDDSFSEWDTAAQRRSQRKDNPYYNENFLTYLIITIFPLAPMLNHALLYLKNFPIADDTNATIESWHKVGCFRYNLNNH